MKLAIKKETKAVVKTIIAEVLAVKKSFKNIIKFNNIKKANSII